jgi:hypothetical protein
MSSSILLQRPREEPLVAEADLRIRIVSVECRIDGISISSVSGGARGSKEEFKFDVEMTESRRMKDSLAVKYSFTFGRPSSGQICKVNGEAAFKFSRLDPESDMHALGGEIDNEMAVEIFRKNFEVVYLLHDTLSLDAPSPWITQEVSLSSRGQTVRDSSGNP